MKLLKTFLFLLLISTQLLGQTSRRIKIAVIDFNVSGVGDEAGPILTERFRSELLNTNKFDVMERTRMEEIFKEQGFQQTGACDDNTCVIQAGKMLGVSGIIAGTIGRVGKIYSVSARIINVETGQIIVSKTEDCECPVENVLKVSMKNLAYKIAGIMPKKLKENDSAGISRLRVVGSPMGAQLTFNGSVIGTIPLNDFQVLPGKYKLKVSALGFETADNSIKINIAETKLINIHLSQKKHSKAIIRSILIPGLGQRYSGKKLKSFFFPFMELAAIGGIIGAELKYDNEAIQYSESIQKYQSAVSTYEIDSTRNQMEQCYISANNAKNQRNIAIGISAGIWIWNIVDVLIWGPKSQNDKRMGSNSNLPKLHFSTIDAQPAISFAVNL